MLCMRNTNDRKVYTSKTALHDVVDLVAPNLNLKNLFLIQGVDKFLHGKLFLKDNEKLLVSFLRAQDQDGIMWCYKTVTMKMRLFKVISEDRSKGGNYDQTLAKIPFFKEHRNLGPDNLCALSRGDIADMLSWTHSELFAYD